MARTKGSPNKATKAREQIAASEGITPLAYLMTIVRDEQAEQATRIDAAKAAAPYIHPRLSQTKTEITGQIDLRQWLTDTK